MLIQGGFLVSRTLLTDYISRVEGYCGKSLTSLVRTDSNQTCVGLRFASAGDSQLACMMHHINKH